MKLINAKEAFLFELGDFGVAEDAKEKPQGESEELAESGTFEVDENGNLVGFEAVEEEDLGIEEPQGEETVAEEEETLTVAEPEAEEPEGEFSVEKDKVAKDGIIIPPTAEEQSACIEAATEAMRDRRMPKKLFDWGLDYITKMGQAQADTLWAEWEAVDKDELRREFEEMDAEDEAKENAEKEQFLRT